MQTWTLRPTPPLAGRIEMCGLDLVGWDRYLNGLHFFDERLDVERLREALSAALTQYPLLAGKIAFEVARVFIDFDGPGVPFAVEQVDEPCPAFGPGVTQANVQRFFHPTPSGDPRQVVRPLLLVKVTRFADGRSAVGVRNSPLLGDSYAAARRFEDWYRHYKGVPVEAPEFSRDPLVALANREPMARRAETAEAPSRRSAVSPASDPPAQESSLTLPHSAIYVSSAERAWLEDLAALGLEDTGGSPVRNPTFDDVLHALLIKSYAAARPPSQKDVTATITYSIRSIAELGLPRDFHGNTVLHRFVTLPRTSAEAPLMDVVAMLAKLNATDAEMARSSIGKYQREYEAGHVSALGTLDGVRAPFGEAGLRINAITHSGPTTFSFGGHALWSEPVFLNPLPIRLAMTYPDRTGGLTVLLSLPEAEAELFRFAWQRSMEELTVQFAAAANRTRPGSDEVPRAERLLH